MKDKSTCTHAPIDATVAATRCDGRDSSALRRQRALADVVRVLFGLPVRYGLTESDREEVAAWIDGLAVHTVSRVAADAPSDLLSENARQAASRSWPPRIARRAGAA